MICPFCRHSDGLHSAPSVDGRADDGGPLSPDYKAGRCCQDKLVDGVWRPCDCPGWHPELEARIPSAAQVKSFYPLIIQPPHAYYELKNRKQSSHFPAGMAPAFYDPFIAYFEERAQTAAAQARLFLRKLKGASAKQYKDAAEGWRAAALVARKRQEKAIDGAVAAEQPVGRPPFEWDDDAPGEATAPAPAHLEAAVQITLF